MKYKMPKRKCLITGVNGAVGSALAQNFSQSGYQVIGTIRKGKSISEDIADYELYALDLDHEESVLRVVDLVSGNHDRLDAAIFTAGGFEVGDLLEMTSTQLNSMVNLNFQTAFYISRALFKKYKHCGPLHFFFFGSSQVFDPEIGIGAAAYTLSKALLYNWVLMLDSQGKRYNIRSHLITPGIIDTPANRKSMPNAEFDKWHKSKEIAVKIEEQIQSDRSLQIISLH